MDVRRAVRRHAGRAGGDPAGIGDPADLARSRPVGNSARIRSEFRPHATVDDGQPARGGGPQNSRHPGRRRGTGGGAPAAHFADHQVQRAFRKRNPVAVDRGVRPRCAAHRPADVARKHFGSF